MRLGLSPLGRNAYVVTVYFCDCLKYLKLGGA